jgi:hypothetical protein
MGYTNPSNVIAALFSMLNEHKAAIDLIINPYAPGKSLTLYEGIRQSVGTSVYPLFEVEPEGSNTEWAAQRLQRTTYTFKCVLTTNTANASKHAHYSATLATILIELMSNPSHLQFEIPDEYKTWLNNEFEKSSAYDSIPSNVMYKSAAEGTIRVVVFTWTVMVNEPYTSQYFDKSLSPKEADQVPAPIIVTPI